MNNLPRIVAVCGKKRSGKDTVADFLCRSFGYTNRKISEDLKKVVQVLFDFSDTQVESDDKDVVDPRWDISPRQAMQFIGTHVMQFEIQKLLTDKSVGRQFWIQSFATKYCDDTNSHIVISDLRFPHEYEILKRYGVYVIRVERQTQASHDLVSEHDSEKEYVNIPTDVVIQNDGTLDDFHEKLRRLFSQTSQYVVH